MRRLLALLWLLPFLFACDQEAAFDKFVPKEEAALAKRVIQSLSNRDFAAVEAQLTPSLRGPELRGKLDEMVRHLPTEAPRAVKTVGAHTRSTDSRTQYDLTFEYEYADRWLLAKAVLERRDNKVTVEGLHFVPRTQSLEAENAFTLSGKGALHYVVLSLAVIIPLFVLYALALCIRTKVPRRKWLWVIFVALGIVQFQFNWSNGAWAVQLLSFSLLGVGFTKAGPVAPYIFTLAFPLGAIVFLANRRSFQARSDA